MEFKPGKMELGMKESGKRIKQTDSEFTHM